jgi:hypothetical protein
MVGSKNEPGERRANANRPTEAVQQTASEAEPTPLTSLDLAIALWDELGEMPAEPMPVVCVPDRFKPYQVISIEEMCEIAAKRIKQAESSDRDKAESSEKDR